GDAEGLVVTGPLLPPDLVAGRLLQNRLGPLLQARLEVPVQPLLRQPERAAEQPFDGRPRGTEPRVQEHRTDQRLESVSEDGRAPAPTGLLLAPTEEDPLAEVEGLGHPREPGLADEHGARLGQLP